MSQQLRTVKAVTFNLPEAMVLKIRNFVKGEDMTFSEFVEIAIEQ